MSLLEPTISPLLLHGGFLLFLTGYALKDILWLRLVTASGYVLFSILCVWRGGMALIELLPWYVAFITVNGLQVGLLVHERWLARLNDDEARLWRLGFAALDRVVFKRFLRLGQVRTLTDGFVLATEGRRGLRFYLVMDGAVDVTLRRRTVARLGPGQFVGEIGFIADRRATATAIARPAADGTPPRFVVWNSPKLRRQMQRDNEVRSLVFAAVGSDLAHKIALQTENAGGSEEEKATSPPLGTLAPTAVAAATMAPAPGTPTAPTLAPAPGPTLVPARIVGSSRAG